MTILYTIIAALLQGVAEFLPVSGSGHLAAIYELTGAGADVNINMLFIAFLQLGTLVAIVITFRRDLQAIVREIAVLLQGGDSAARTAPTPPARIAFLVAAATVPMLLAIPLYSAVRTLFVMPAFIGLMVVVTGALLYVTSRYIKKGTKTERTFSITDAIVVGLAQLVSLVPGLSRAGATIAVALTRGANRDFAIKFSYLMSIPAILGAFIATFVGAVRNNVLFTALPLCLLGFVISAIVGVFAISFLRRMMTKDRFTLFGYYNVIAGTLIIILSLIF